MAKKIELKPSEMEPTLSKKDGGKKAAVSQKQWRFMKLISEGDYDPSKAPERGGPPKDIADQFGPPAEGAPEYANGKSPSRGGSWTHERFHGHHEKRRDEHRSKGKHEEADAHEAHRKHHKAKLKELGRKAKRGQRHHHKKADAAFAAGDYDRAKHHYEMAHGHGTHAHRKYTPAHQHTQASSFGKIPKAKVKRYSKKKVKKSEDAFESFYKGMGTGLVVVDSVGRILIGKQPDGLWATPGGHVEPGESFEQAAIRELKEETGINAHALGDTILEGKAEGNDSKTFVVTDFSGRLTDTEEMKQNQFVHPHELPEMLRPCSAESIVAYLKTMKKSSLSSMLAIEKLEKNILRGESGRDAVYEMSHGDSLKLVGSGIFKLLKKVTSEMKDEDFKQVKLGEYSLHIRKHMSDVYSGRVEDGHKLIHQFSKRSLPQIAADLMSLFEWYAPEDEDVFSYIKDDMEDDVIHGGIKKLMDNYKRHNIGEIYGEMENIREEIRRGVAVDLQQVEARMMKLFDRLDKVTSEMAEKHTGLGSKMDKDVETIEKKLAELQAKLDELHAPKKSEVTAVSSVATPSDSKKILDEYYPYLPKPEVHISPDGKIKIIFAEGWNHMEKENFLNDLKAKVIRKQDA
jgi:8-oxo-dGTP pyrophosphatase MutT (NUDIX family)